MERIPAITTGTRDFTMASGLEGAIVQMAIPDRAVPNAAPRAKFHEEGGRMVYSESERRERRKFSKEESSGTLKISALLAKLCCKLARVYLIKLLIMLFLLGIASGHIGDTKDLT